jgi:colicin import membrane protein
MTEKEKAIEDETIELSTEPTEKKKPHRRRAIVITVVALALLAAGGIAWKTHTDHLMAEARADCAAASEHLRTATNGYNTLLNGNAANAAKTDRKSVKDAKTLDALSKAVKASTPKTVSCKADSRTGVQDVTKAITANASWYEAHTKSLNRLVNAVETSKLDKTVDDANALYEETDGKVADGKTRASLLDAIKKRDADAIAKAVKEVNESKTAKEKADAEAKAKAEQEAAAAAAAQQA